MPSTGRGPSRGLLRDCENFAKVRFQLNLGYCVSVNVVSVDVTSLRVHYCSFSLQLNKAASRLITTHHIPTLVPALSCSHLPSFNLATFNNKQNWYRIKKCLFYVLYKTLILCNFFALCSIHFMWIYYGKCGNGYQQLHTYSHASWDLGYNIQPHRIIYILAFLTKYTVETWQEPSKVSA